jgi:hypothetical protein
MTVNHFCHCEKAKPTKQPIVRNGRAGKVYAAARPFSSHDKRTMGCFVALRAPRNDKTIGNWPLDRHVAALLAMTASFCCHCEKAKPTKQPIVLVEMDERGFVAAWDWASRRAENYRQSRTLGCFVTTFLAMTMIM